MDFQVDPDQSEMYDELEKRGLKASNIHTKEDEIKVLQMIRAIPRPIYMKRDMKWVGFFRVLDGPRHKKTSLWGVCEQQRCRAACASAQSDQHLCYLLFVEYHI